MPAQRRGHVQRRALQAEAARGEFVPVHAGIGRDVVVDIRVGSPTFGQWVGELHSAENNRQLWVPEGFAHGFLVLSESAEFLYKTTDYYAPAAEVCLRWNDPVLAIAWPEVDKPVLSVKDGQGLDWHRAPWFG